jgi:IS30 family transposase
LAQDYSPEQVVGTLKKGSKLHISAERIYQYIWQDKKQKGSLYKHLRTRGKRCRKSCAYKDLRGEIKDRIPIILRPKIVDEKTRFGALKIDTVIGKNHKGAIVTINDSATSILRTALVEKKEAELVKNAAIELLKE